MNLDFEGKFNVILKNLIKGHSVELTRSEDWFTPLFEDPAELYMREKIISHLLLHGGYLTEDGTRKSRYKIPNLELMQLFHSQLDEYLSRYPISDETISILSKALLDQNYAAFGDEVIKCLHDVYLIDNINDTEKYKRQQNGKIISGNYPLEIHIHRLLWKVFMSMSEGRCFYAKKYSGEKGDPADSEIDSEYFFDFIFSPKWAEGNAHFVFELKTETAGRKDFLLNSLVGLHQIFEKNYHKDLLPYENTKAIVNFGITANATNLSLLIYKMNIKEENYQSAEKLMYQEFNATKGPDNGTVVAHSDVKEHEIDMFNSHKTYNQKARKRRKGTEFKIRKNISTHLWDLIHNPSKFNETVVQTNPVQISTALNTKK
jgi:hypothetical protein